VRDRLERRLEELTAEYEAGQKMLAELEARQVALRDTMLRINGAMTVLKEELGADRPLEDAPPGADGAPTAAPSPAPPPDGRGLETGR
jgi:hypothetical protein